MGPFINPIEINRKYESWLRNCSIYLKSIKIKDDFGFSEYVHTENKPDFKIGGIKLSLTTSDKNFLKEIKNLVNEKINILESIKNSFTISKTKLFDCINGQYYLDGIPINLNKKTLSYILFDSTYKIKPDGGEILYTQLKKYLTSNNVNYKDKKSNKKMTFWEENTESMRKKVQNNLCGGKGVLKLKMVNNYLLKNNITGVFVSQRDSKSYLFNNKK